MFLVLAAAARPCHAATERETHRFTPPLKPIDLRVTVGEIEIRATDRADIVVDIEREAADAAGLALIPANVADTEDTLVVDVTQRDGQASAAVRVRIVINVPLLGDVQAGARSPTAGSWSMASAAQSRRGSTGEVSQQRTSLVLSGWKPTRATSP